MRAIVPWLALLAAPPALAAEPEHRRVMIEQSDCACCAALDNRMGPGHARRVACAPIFILPETGHEVARLAVDVGQDFLPPPFPATLADHAGFVPDMH